MHVKFGKLHSQRNAVAAPAHRTRATTAYLNANNVNVVDPPPPPKKKKKKKNHQINIIEDILDEVNRRVRRTVAIPKTLNQLRAKILYEWNNLPQNYVQRFVTSMRRRCLVVVRSVGGHTHGHGRRCRI